MRACDCLAVGILQLAFMFFWFLFMAYKYKTLLGIECRLSSCGEHELFAKTHLKILC